MLHLLAGALSTTFVAAGDSITADWDDIAVDAAGGPTGVGSTDIVTINFSVGTNRFLQVVIDEDVGSLRYKLNGAGSVTITNGQMITVEDGDTVQFLYNVHGENVDIDITIRDYTLNEVIDTFNIEVINIGGA